MNRMQKWLERAAEELGVRIFVGYNAQLPDGNSIQTQALFPDFGGALGMIVISETVDASILRHWVMQGFAISTFSEPLPNEEFDLDNYSEMFSEWGWTSYEGSKPAWMR
jgi:hypothetical protein